MTSLRVKTRAGPVPQPDDRYRCLPAALTCTVQMQVVRQTCLCCGMCCWDCQSVIPRVSLVSSLLWYLTLLPSSVLPVVALQYEVLRCYPSIDRRYLVRLSSGLSAVLCRGAWTVSCCWWSTSKVAIILSDISYYRKYNITTAKCMSNCNAGVCVLVNLFLSDTSNGDIFWVLCFPVGLIGFVKYLVGSVKQKYECCNWLCKFEDVFYIQRYVVLWRS
jgi:hypothetical protein